MKAPIERIMVFTITVIAHGKDSHGGLWPVVRYIVNYGVPRTTIGAVDKGVQVSPVLLVKEFPEAIGAGCCVGRYEGCSLFTLFAGFNLETIVISCGQFLGVYLGNSCQWRGQFREFF